LYVSDEMLEKLGGTVEEGNLGKWFYEENGRWQWAHAIFGMYGASIIYMRKTFGQSIVGALMYAFLLLMLSTGAGVNIIAHFGGLATGLIIGYTLAKSRKDMIWIENY